MRVEFSDGTFRVTPMGIDVVEPFQIYLPDFQLPTSKRWAANEEVFNVPE